MGATSFRMASVPNLYDVVPTVNTSLSHNYIMKVIAHGTGTVYFAMTSAPVVSYVTGDGELR